MCSEIGVHSLTLHWELNSELVSLLWTEIVIFYYSDKNLEGDLFS